MILLTVWLFLQKNLLWYYVIVLTGTNYHMICFSINRIPYTNSEDATIKRCPVCHVPIERNDGCAQMMCKRCKHVFCWYCLMSLDVSIRSYLFYVYYKCKHVFCWYCLTSLDVIDISRIWFICITLDKVFFNLINKND